MNFKECFEKRNYRVIEVFEMQAENHIVTEAIRYKKTNIDISKWGDKIYVTIFYKSKQIGIKQFKNDISIRHVMQFINECLNKYLEKTANKIDNYNIRLLQIEKTIKYLKDVKEC